MWVALLSGGIDTRIVPSIEWGKCMPTVCHCVGFLTRVSYSAQDILGKLQYKRVGIYLSS